MRGFGVRPSVFVIHPRDGPDVHGDKRLQLNEFRREAKNEGLTPRRFELASPHEAPPGWKPVGDGPEARPASDLKAIKLHVLSSIQSHQSPPRRHLHRLVQ